MSEEEFFNRLLNKIAKEFGYDVASTLELMFMTKEKKIEQLENIRKEAITYILANCEIIRHKKENVDEVGRVNGAELLNILNKGSESNVKD